MSGDLMRTAEEERSHQAPIVEDAAATFAAAMQKDEGRPTTKAHQAKAHAPPPAKPNTGAHAAHLPAKSSSGGPSVTGSPSASSSPHHLSLPYAHPPSVFAAQAVYLAPNASPSQLDGFTAKEEFQLRAHTCVFMSGIGQKLKLGQLALATASVFVQVFFTHYSFKALDRLEIALTCLFLAGKVEERRTCIDHVMSAYYIEKEEFDRKMAYAAGEGELYAPRPAPLVNSSEWDSLRQRIYKYESVLLDAIEYNFEVMHPYSFLRRFIEKFIYSPLYAKESDSFIQRHISGAGGLAQIAWNFINDSLRTSLCIQYSPSVICVVALRMAMHHLIRKQQLAGEPVKSQHLLLTSSLQATGPTKPWHEELFGLPKKTMHAISNQIMDVLDTIKDDNLESLLAVHRKSKLKSCVPIPCPRSTVDLMASLRAQEQHHQQRAYQQRAPLAPQPPRAHGPTAPGVPAPVVAPADRKRGRSPSRREEAREARVAERTRTAEAAGFAPLPCPPSPFLDATAAHPSKHWLPDLRPNAIRKERERHREGDRHARDKEPPRRRSRSHSRRSRSRSRKRSHPRDTRGQVEHEAPPRTSPLEEGEVRVEALPPMKQEPMAVGHADLLLSPRARLSSGGVQLTKSCSTLDLSVTRPHAVGSSALPSRLHASMSMSSLSSLTGSDILSGDILKMSTCHSPSDPHQLGTAFSTKTEDEIMRDIQREAKSLKSEKREEEHHSPGADEQRAAKRPRIGSRNNSPTETARSGPGAFEGAHSAQAPAALASNPTDSPCPDGPAPAALAPLSTPAPAPVAASNLAAPDVRMEPPTEEKQQPTPIGQLAATSMAESKDQMEESKLAAKHEPTPLEGYKSAMEV